MNRIQKNSWVDFKGKILHVKEVENTEDKVIAVDEMTQEEFTLALFDIELIDKEHEKYKELQTLKIKLYMRNNPEKAKTIRDYNTSKSRAKTFILKHSKPEDIADVYLWIKERQEYWKK